MPNRFLWCYDDSVFIKCTDELVKIGLITIDNTDNPTKYIITKEGEEEYKKQTYQSIASNYLVGLESIDISNSSCDLARRTTELTEKMMNLTRLMALLAIITILVSLYFGLRRDTHIATAQFEELKQIIQNNKVEIPETINTTITNDTLKVNNTQ